MSRCRAVLANEAAASSGSEKRVRRLAPDGAVAFKHKSEADIIP